MKNPPVNAGDPGSTPGLRRSPGAGNAAHSSTLAWEISMDRGAWRATVHGVSGRQTRLSDHAQPGDWKRRDEPRWQQRVTSKLERARHRRGPSVPSQSPAQGGRGRAGRTPANPPPPPTARLHTLGTSGLGGQGGQESAWEKGRVRR